MPANRDLEFYAGDDVELVFVLRDSAGVIIDLSGWTSRIQIRKRVSYITHIIEKTAVITPAEGKIAFSFTPAEVTLLLGGKLDFSKTFWDLETTNVLSKVLTLMKGRVFTQGDLTR